MDYTPPPIKRDFVTNPDGSVRPADGKTGFFRRLVFWVITIAAILLAAFVWLGYARVHFISNIPILSSMQSVSHKIITNLTGMCHELFGAM